MLAYSFMFNIIQKRKIWLSISSGLVIFSIYALFAWGLHFGIDFTGGSLMEVKFNVKRPSISEVQDALKSVELGGLVLQPVNEDNLILRFQDVTEEKHQAVLKSLSKLVEKPADSVKVDVKATKDKTVKTSTSSVAKVDVETTDSKTGVNFEELRYDSVGPSIGAELKRKALLAVIYAVIGIGLYIAWAFRKVSKPVASWKYGLAAIIALAHDVIITMGFFSIFSHFHGAEVNSAFIAAILTVLGYSINDTIVVFDRVRENLPKSHDDFEGTVNFSVNQTLVRSLNASFTVLLTLIAILIFGGASIRDFALALTIGIGIGTYSSIFVAVPFLVIFEKGKK